MENEGFTIQPWQKIRSILGLFLKFQRPLTVYGYGEADVTKTLRKIDSLSEQSGEKLSLHTYLIYLFSQVAVKNPLMISYRSGNHLLTFKDVDLCLPILKVIPGGIRIPVMYTVKKADKKTLASLHVELQKAIKGSLQEDNKVKFRRSLLKLPVLIQYLLYFFIFNSPQRLKKYFGNMGVTSLQFPGLSVPFIGLPPNVYTIQFAIGSISEKFLPDADGKPSLRKVLHVAAGVDHLILDGMDMASIVKDISDAIESAIGLDQSFVREIKKAAR